MSDALQNQSRPKTTSAGSAGFVVLVVFIFGLALIFGIQDLSATKASLVGVAFAVFCSALVFRLIKQVQRSEAAERILSERAEFIDTLLVSLSDLGEGVTVSKGERLVYVNDAFVHLSGYSRTEILQLPSASALLKADDVDKWQELRSQVAEGRNDSVMTFLLQAKDESTIPIEASSKQIMIDGQPHRMSVIRDIRQRREWEQGLLDERERLHSRNIQLHDAAHTDALTHLSNRRSADESLAFLCKEAANTGIALSIVIIDVDYFKKVNDNYGHVAGDSVLQQVATTISEGLRNDDVAARWGGEEFIVILPRTGAEGALRYAERIRRLLEEMEVIVTGAILNVTASFGVAVGFDADDLLAKADAALYRAKEEGRNRVRS